MCARDMAFASRILAVGFEANSAQNSVEARPQCGLFELQLAILLLVLSYADASWTLGNGMQHCCAAGSEMLAMSIHFKPRR